MLKRGTSTRSVKAPLVPPTATGTAATRSPPTDPVAPGEGVPRPTDVLVARLNEIKRVSKSLAAYYSTLGHAHEAHGKALTTLAQGETIRLPWLEQDLFLPHVGAPEGEGGWAELVGKLKDGTGQEAEDHLELSRITSSEIVEPLKHLARLETAGLPRRVTIKNYIADLEKHVNPLLTEVAKAREHSFNSIQALTTSVGTYTNSPLTVSAEQDPLIVRAKTESLMREQITKENELLGIVKEWQERTKTFEAESFATIASAVQKWEVESLKRFDTTRAHGRDIISRLDRLNPEVEWQHFISLNYLIPDDTPTRSLDTVEYPDNAHASTKPIKEGILERKKRVVKNWKEAYFVLSSAGFLHEYPDSTTPLTSPSASLFLPNCVVTQVTNPEPGKDRHATFTISGRQSTASGSMRGTFGMQHSDVARSYRARSYAEALEWWTEIAKLSKSPNGTDSAGVPAQDQGPAPVAVQRAGLPSEADDATPPVAAASEVSPTSIGDVATGAAAGAAVGAATGAAVATAPVAATAGTAPENTSLRATSGTVPEPSRDFAAASTGPSEYAAQSPAPAATVAPASAAVSSPAAAAGSSVGSSQGLSGAPTTADVGSSFMRLNEPVPATASSVPAAASGVAAPTTTASAPKTSVPAPAASAPAPTTSAPAPTTSASSQPASSSLAPPIAPAGNGSASTSAAAPTTSSGTAESSAAVIVDSDGNVNKHLQKETKRPSWLHFAKKKHHKEQAQRS